MPTTETNTDTIEFLDMGETGVFAYFRLGGRYVYCEYVAVQWLLAQGVANRDDERMLKLVFSAFRATRFRYDIGQE